MNELKAAKNLSNRLFLIHAQPDWAFFQPLPAASRCGSTWRIRRSLSAERKESVLRRLAGRIGKDGVLRVISRQTPSQAANRESAVERFVELLRDVLRQLPVRKKTRVNNAAMERRLEEEKQRSIVKQARTERDPIED